MSRKWLAWLTILCVLGIVMLANLGYADVFRPLLVVPGRDVTGHFIVMGVLGFMVNRGLSSATVAGARLGVARLTAILLALITLEELSQAFIATRTFSWVDLLASYAGVVTAAILVHWLASRAAAAQPSIGDPGDR